MGEGQKCVQLFKNVNDGLWKQDMPWTTHESQFTFQHGRVGAVRIQHHPTGRQSW